MSAELTSGTASETRAHACIKRENADWRVYEELDFEFSGRGEHAYFYVEKDGFNTAEVAGLLARACGVEPRAVGFAGMKDKHAITRQWFSVPRPDDDWPLQLAGIHCLEAARHGKKLRRGQHRVNRFEIRLRDAADLTSLHEHQLGAAFPNYFGPQRTSAGNVAQAVAWLANRRRRRDARRGWHLSVLRSFLFNAVLRERVQLQAFNRAVPGDVLLDASPSGPLWGRGRSAVSDEAATIERAALAPHAEICEGLEYAGVVQARRALAAAPQEFAIERLGAADYGLRFVLPPGSYATALLAHTLTFVDAGGRG